MVLKQPLRQKEKTHFSTLLSLYIFEGMEISSDANTPYEKI